MRRRRPALAQLRTRSLRDRPVLAVFLSLSAVPILLAVFSFRQPIPLPPAVLSGFEVLFRLLVYAPVSIVRSLLFEPLGLAVIFDVAGLEQATIVLVLVCVYYLVSLAAVRGARLLRRFGRWIGGR